jgi:hypothetical protein
MPETDFLLGSADQTALFRLLLEAGATLIPALRYTSENYLSLSSLDAIEQIVDSGELAGPFYVLPNGNASHPLDVFSLQWQGETRYFIRDGYGGPILTFFPL